MQVIFTFVGVMTLRLSINVYLRDDKLIFIKGTTARIRSKTARVDVAFAMTSARAIPRRTAGEDATIISLNSAQT